MSEQHRTRVVTEVWDICDTYLTIKVQLNPFKFEVGDIVEVTIEKIKNDKRKV